ncbi:MAG: hypothetical protein JRI87_11105 [Deltaproteobacteria bacterium]|nr:hypothetical protein [Deltaproteobacteria bacterium]
MDFLSLPAMVTEVGIAKGLRADVLELVKIFPSRLWKPKGYLTAQSPHSLGPGISM